MSKPSKGIAPLKAPCPSCPWRKDRCAADIPNFNLEMAEQLVSTVPDKRGFGPDLGSPMFACHTSKEEGEFACAGWLAKFGHRHPIVRYMVSTGDIQMSQLQPDEGWPELHEDYQEVLDKLRAG